MVYVKNQDNNQINNQINNIIKLYTMYLSTTTSLIAFIIGTLSALYLLYNGSVNNSSDTIFGIITLTFSIIQLFDVILRNNSECNTTNHIFSLLVIIVLYLQGILSCMAYYKINTENNFFNKDSINTYYILYTLFTVNLLIWLNRSNVCSSISEATNILKYGAYNKLKDNYILLIMHIFFAGFIGLILITEVYNKDYEIIINNKLKYSFLPIIAGISFLYVMIKEVEVLKNLDISKEIDHISDSISERKIPIKNPKENPINPIKLLDYSGSFVSVASFLATFIGPITMLRI
tara:strand:- start:698 stop:1570 length:873 start_codon:yes stop_codon:yes gene_type:complete